MNNLEKDRRYAQWPSSVQDILRPTFPGMLRHVRKNFFHMVGSGSSKIMILISSSLSNLQTLLQMTLFPEISISLMNQNF